jgi:hypothetical protein
MIRISQKKLKNDGILFILWGWLLFYISITGYISKVFGLSWEVQNIFGWSGIILLVVVLILTIYYLLKKRKKARTYIGDSLKYIWISAFVCLVFINLIQFNVLHSIKFELQHPIYMVVFAFAIVSTGGILRYKMIIVGGIIFGLSALLASYFSITVQMLLEALAWLIAFVIPGHILYAKRNS